MTADHSDAPRPRRLPHWGWLLGMGLTLFVAFVGVFIAWPAYRVQKALESVHRCIQFATFEEILDAERPAWRQSPDDVRPLFLPLIDRPKSLTLYECELTDDDLIDLSSLREIESLHLNASRLGDAGFTQISRFRELKDLSITINRPVTRERFGRLARLEKLESLRIFGSGVSDESLEALEGFSSLKDLTLHSTLATGKGFSKLAASGRLRKLRLSGSPVDDAGMLEICRIESLEHLDLGDSNVTRNGLAALKSLERLQSFRIGARTNVYNPLSHLSERVSLRMLDFSNPADHPRPFNDEDAKALARHKELQTVCLDDSDVTDKTVALLATLPELEYVGLSNTVISEEGLRILKAMKRLKGVRLMPAFPNRSPPNALLSPAQIAEFFETRPDVEALEYFPEPP